MDAPLAWYNGRFIPKSEAHIALNDAGFVLGVTITDFCRTFHHRLFRLAEHLERFRDNCRYAHIPLWSSNEELSQAAEGLVRLNARFLTGDQELALILLATPGPIDYYLGHETASGETPPTQIMHTFPLPFGNYADWFREGARLAVPSVRQVSSSCMDPHIKHRSRFHWWLASQEVQRLDPAASPILLNQDGYVTENSRANLLIVRNGKVISPPRADVLDGISLRVTEQLCRELAIPFEKAPLTVSECETSAEAFLTGTAFCLAGVKSVNGMALPWPGPVTEALSAAWTQLVGLDFRKQILSLE